VNRRDLQSLARIRAAEAGYLRAGGHYAGAYYLAGYVVECALKACIAKTIRRHEFPDKKYIDDSYTHDLERLIRLAGLRPQLDADMQVDPRLKSNWSVAARWSEQSRYEERSRPEAEELLQSILDRRYGVFQWLRRYW